MNKILLILLAFCMTGCVSLNHRSFNYWNDGIRFGSETAQVVGNPRVTCYNKADDSIIADGFIVYIDGQVLVIDEFGKGYKYLFSGNDKNVYCKLWERS